MLNSELLAMNSKDDLEDNERYIIRIKTSSWMDKNGLHCKKSIRRMERLSIGFEFLSEDCRNGGCLETFESIRDIFHVPDGLYELVVMGGTSYEGHFEIDGYRLIPYEKEEK
jgi:hypothetical protein